MVARARNIPKESYTKYRKNLIKEANWLKWRLKGGYRWGQSYFSWAKFRAMLKKLRLSGLMGKVEPEPIQSRQQARVVSRAKVKRDRKVQRTARRVARGV